MKIIQLKWNKDILAQTGVKTPRIQDVCWRENVTHREKTALFAITLSVLTKNSTSIVYQSMKVDCLVFSETISWYFCSVQEMNELAEIKMKSLNVSFIIQQISERLFYIVSIICWRCSKEREAAGINGDFNVCFSVIL